ncbi:transcription-repair coupling factor (superfamily II helicase) [Sphingomonas kaistensis]|uniref:Transcription-repair-coupling factor n=1 Tax=Sphingomonas kaistensis TaxID=298708 RepID=A0A7X5Y6J7_9SPHN|nr:helicase-related protein [Sphingomonas kaistensis]NJC05522.1 transcription-repair coupling factor (superfamily II helicase) [Sphingomonas kaistensis]
MARGDEKTKAAELEIGEVVAALLTAEASRLLFLARDEVRADSIARAATQGAGDRLVLHLPASDVLPGDDAPTSASISGQRTAALRHLAEALGEGRRVLLVSSGEAAGRLLAPPSAYSAKPPMLRPGEPLDLESFSETARALGYQDDDRVDEPGEVAVRGSVADLYPGDRQQPVRIEVVDGAIAAIRSFDPLTQLTCDELERVEVGIVAEPRVAEGVTLADHLPGAVLAQDPGADGRRKLFLALAADTARRRPARATADICDEKRWQDAIASFDTIDLAKGQQEAPPRFVEQRAPERAFVRFAKAVLSEGRIVAILGSARDVRFLCPRVARALKTEVDCVDSWNEVVAASPGSVVALTMAVPRGFTHGQLVAIAAGDLIGSRAVQEAGAASVPGELFAAPEIRPGDIVIHEDHGLAAVTGLTELPEDGGDAIVLRFAGDARRLVPVADAGKLWRYGSDEDSVTLDKLDGSSWEKRRGEVLAAVAETARGLVALAAERAEAEAPAIEPDAARFEQLVASFPFTETADQQKAISAIRSDLASARPMDRLVVGDVGFGKTEVALRAAAMAVFAGKQVAMAAPTTVLARQHLETFRSRFGELGIEVAMLSRLVSPADKKKVLAGLADGSIAIVVGTGAVAGKGAVYKNLGLVIIDEEQRFGAKDKDKLRGLGAPHALSLTATPIPRTLQSALVGLQPVSILATPPARRQPIRTEVGGLDEAKLRTALMRERSRGGQSFVVVPRIEDMDPLGDTLARLVPELSVVRAHGKMPAAEIDESMVGFASGDGDVLLATNIIEAGLDVPRANTMVVMRAENFGLAQLHQLRGRVGRGARRGHILLMTGKADIPKRTLDRLNTLAAFDRLGAGFAISARDLDLRGAGDLLGEEQSGHLKLIGIDLYQNLLGKALRHARGEDVSTPEPELRLDTAGQLPAEWIPEEEVRLALYLRLARLEDSPGLDSLRAEMADRFGELPEEAEALLASAQVRNLARAAGVRRIDAGPAAIAITPADAAADVPEPLEGKDGRWLLRPQGERPSERLVELEAVLAELAGD